MFQASQPTVAVIIAAYNAEDSIVRAVRSALAEQDVTEVWVIDDRSTDGTIDRARGCDDGSGRLRILEQPVNGGPAAARNRALAQSRATWVCVLDSDDYFLPGRISRLLAQASGVEMIADELIRVRAEETGDPEWTGSVCEGGRLVDLAAFVEGNISRPGRYRQELGFIKPLMRSGFLADHGLRYDERLRLGEDYHLYARVLSVGGRLRIIGPQGYVAVVRADSLSGRHTIGDLLALRNCDRDIARHRPLAPAESRALDDHYVSVDQRLQWRRLIEAVKDRRPAAALSTFTTPRVSLFLLRQLMDQAWLRAVGSR